MHSRDPALAPLHCLMSFSQAVHVRRMVAKITVDPKQTFWILVVNTLLSTAAVEWSKVFGSRSEQTHWTHRIPEGEQPAIRDALLQQLTMTPDQWSEYRKTIVDYRDQLVAHHDLNATPKYIPKYDHALVAADFMFTELRGRADQDWLGRIPVNLDEWARGVAGNMSAIVRKAFTASADLGSNVPSH
ncbi:MAG: hypothetical protein EKK45_29805 [Curvibacter sp.]|nr:MAG: hypothetical protein EKK45_29805 [Curvibacter sp.]